MSVSKTANSAILPFSNSAASCKRTSPVKFYTAFVMRLIFSMLPTVLTVVVVVLFFLIDF